MKALSVIMLLAALVLAAVVPASATVWQKQDAARHARWLDKPDSRVLCYFFWPFPFGCKCGAQEQDSDMDGVPDGRDKCPNTPAGCVVDIDGCPKDADGDGVCDGVDKCPGTPKGATVDARGCPMDSDGDGVFDGIDQCPGTPKGAAVNAKGCPMDSDGDGVPDGIDRCPDTQRGAKVDASGCPIDSDGDGVPDGIDRCPNTPAGTKVDETGCPVEVRNFIDTGLISTTKILFDTGKSTLKPESKKEIDAIGNILVQVPDVKVEVGGHTDNVGSDKLNMKLSDERAKAVRDYLVKNFPQLHADNYSAKGYGEAKPVASNDTKEGKAQNRRVEFRIMK
jgi:OOP family OmpA-OmpF porin